MSGGKGKSHGGKAGPKGAADGSRQQVSHSAKAGLQVRNFLRSHMVIVLSFFWRMNGKSSDRNSTDDERRFYLNAFEFSLVAFLCSSMACWLVVKALDEQERQNRIRNKQKRNAQLWNAD